MTLSIFPWSNSFLKRILLLPFFLLFIGNLQIPINASLITVPMGMVIIFPIFLSLIITCQINISKIIFSLAGVIFCGFIGFLLTPEATISRSAAGVLPLVFSIMTISVYERYPILYEKSVNYMLAGGGVFAIIIVYLFFYSLRVHGDYYQQKLVIATPLGRSNYLSAFLIFLFALSISRNVFLSILFFVAILCTMSRGGVLALLIFVNIIYYLKNKNLWVFGSGVMLILILAFLIWIELLNVSLDSSQIKSFDLQSVINRFDVWKFSLYLISKSPIFGIGPNTFRTYMQMNHNIEDVSGTHNSVFLTILNYGFIGILLYANYLYLIYMKILNAEKIEGKLFILRTVFIALLIFGLYEPLVGSASFEMLFAFIYVLVNNRVRMVCY